VALLGSEASARLARLQMVEDALAYRRQRLSLPCSDCTPGSRCIDHARDEGLVENYRYMCALAIEHALEGADPADIAEVMESADVPPTAGALSVLALAQLRERAADGPVETVLNGRRVIVELDGQGNLVRRGI